VTLRIALDPDSGPALYEQLRAGVAEQARSGALPVGYRLPTVRALAAELGLAVNTVAKAYRALEADGVVETRGRAGTFVAAAGDAAARQVAEAAAGLARLAHRLGVSREAARATVEDALRVAYGTGAAAGKDDTPGRN
jgi:DNA-binding transcriptional regulator YhcF (GntR family)